MHSSLAAWRAAASDRDAIARTSIQALLCMAGMTLRVPILAVLRIPQTTFFMLAAVYVYRPVIRGQNQRSDQNNSNWRWCLSDPLARFARVSPSRRGD